MNTPDELVKLTDIEVESRPMGHLGLIATYFEELGLRDFFDGLLPKKREHRVSHGTAILAFLLNGLSFAQRQLYLFDAAPRQECRCCDSCRTRLRL